MDDIKQCWEHTNRHDTPAARIRCVMEQGHDPISLGPGYLGHNFGGLGPFTPGATRWRDADGKLRWTFDENKTFTCEWCHQAFLKVSTDEEMTAEAEVHGFDLAGDNMIVCDDCFQALMAANDHPIGQPRRKP